MQKYESKEGTPCSPVTGNEFDSTFRKKYIQISKKIYYLNAAIYAYYPVAVNNEEQKKKIRGLSKCLSSVRSEITNEFREDIDRGDKDNASARHKLQLAAVKELIKLIDETRKKLIS